MTADRRETGAPTPPRCAFPGCELTWAEHGGVLHAFCSSWPAAAPVAGTPEPLVAEARALVRDAREAIESHCRETGTTFIGRAPIAGSASFSGALGGYGRAVRSEERKPDWWKADLVAVARARVESLHRDEVERLTTERDELREMVVRLSAPDDGLRYWARADAAERERDQAQDAWRKRDEEVWEERNKRIAAERERDEARAERDEAMRRSLANSEKWSEELGAAEAREAEVTERLRKWSEYATLLHNRADAARSAGDADHAEDSYRTAANNIRSVVDDLRAALAALPVPDNDAAKEE